MPDPTTKRTVLECACPLPDGHEGPCVDREPLEAGGFEEGSRLDAEAAAQAEAARRAELADVGLEAEPDDVDDYPDLPADHPARHEPAYTAGELARLDGLLEVNGFNAVRAEVVHAVSTLERIPPEAYEAGKAYAERAAARMRLDTVAPADQRAAAIRQAERDVAVFEAARRFRRELERLAESIATRERLAGGR
jgi:hypothetical protein